MLPLSNKKAEIVEKPICSQHDPKHRDKAQEIPQPVMAAMKRGQGICELGEPTLARPF
jgi:hypothetical protein